MQARNAYIHSRLPSFYIEAAAEENIVLSVVLKKYSFHLLM